MLIFSWVGAGFYDCSIGVKYFGEPAPTVWGIGDRCCSMTIPDKVSFQIILLGYKVGAGSPIDYVTYQ
ncbi:hypothetical protein PN499_15325 [Kamptonema animale CS-326]|uniref:hypothetical protein n=1 Tax=Kamptonema animale TaxID=92934 RepID=UPI00232FB159|nr:hypothetical protein [Kamptonema animale]MDB9512562.1 hypothetical protein [Kamptonema animale CS-326]